MSNLNWLRWTNALGLKRDDAPPLVQAVQPVILAADLSRLVGVPEPPRLLIGGRGGGALSVGAFVASCVDPADIELRISNPTANVYYLIQTMGVGDALQGGTFNEQASTRVELGSQATVGTYRIGEFTLGGPSGTNVSRLMVGGNNISRQSPSFRFHVPAGHYLVLNTITLASGLDYSADIVERPTPQS